MNRRAFFTGLLASTAVVPTAIVPTAISLPAAPPASKLVSIYAEGGNWRVLGEAIAEALDQKVHSVGFASRLLQAENLQS